VPVGGKNKKHFTTEAQNKKVKTDKIIPF